MFTYTNDERFQVLHAEGSDDWTLQIKYVQKRDNGTYECQVSLAGENSGWEQKIYEIWGEGDLAFYAGETQCVVIKATQKIGLFFIVSESSGFLKYKTHRTFQEGLANLQLSVK